MDTKTLFGFTVIPAAALGALVLASVSKRIRDVFFILMVFLTPMIEFLDVNYVSREWYRGTSRGFEVSVLDILLLSLLASSILAPRQGERRFYWPASLGLIVLFFIYACYNVCISEPMLFGLFELSKMVRGIMIFAAAALYLRSERELRLLIFALGMSVSYQAALAFKQRYYSGVHRVYGTLDDSNSLSVYFCTTAPFFVAALSSRLPRLLKCLCAVTIVMACLGEILTISRAGVIIIGAVLLGAAVTTMSWQITRKRIAIALVIMLGVGGVTAKSWNTLKTRFAESNLSQEYGHSKKNLGRGYYIRIAEAIAKDNWLGVGLNNWSFWVSNKYGPRLGYWFVPYRGTDTEPSNVVPSESNVDEPQAAPAHSLGALTVGELGIPGFILFTFIWLRWFQMGASFLLPRTPEPMRRMAVGILFSLLGIFLQSLTEWVFRHLPIYYTIHILLGALASLYYVRRCERKSVRLAMEQEFEPAESPVLGPIYATRSMGRLRTSPA